MRKSLRNREDAGNAVRTDICPWTRRHHRQRGHGPMGASRKRAGMRPKNTPPSNGQFSPVHARALAQRRCAVPNCTGHTHDLAKDDSRATTVVVGHIDLIRNPKWYEGCPKEIPRVFKIPVTRKALACLDCWVRWNAVSAATPHRPFLWDGKYGYHEIDKLTGAITPKDNGLD